MERRLTAFLLPVLLVAPLLFLLARESPPAAKPPASAPSSAGRSPAAPPPPSPPAGEDDGPKRPHRFARTFGQLGERGALHVVFDRRAASIAEIRLLDEPISPAAARMEPAARGIEGSYPLVLPVQVGLTALTLAEADRDAPSFGVDLFQQWQDEEREDGVAFSLSDPGTGLTLEKVYRHEPGWRGLRLTLTLRAAADRSEAALASRPTGFDVRLDLRGPSLVNPIEDHILGQNPAILIGRSVDAQDGARIVVQHPPSSRANLPEAPVAAAGGGYVDFAGSTNRFFAGLLSTAGDAARQALRQVVMEAWPARQPLPQHQLYSVPVPRYELSLAVPPPGQSTTADFRLFLGPKSSRVFDERPEYAAFEAVMDSDLMPMCFCDIPGARHMARLLLWLMRLLESVFGNWGVAIVVMTLLVRGSLVPLNFRMQKSMRAYGAKMAVLKPKMDALRERYKNDPKRLNQELQAFQREHKLLPPLGGCLPLLVTIPVFLGLFTALRVAYELRYQPFFSWIDDLSRPDQLFAIGWSWLPYFNVLPILMVGLWLLLQASTPLPSDPQQRQVMKIMRFMPLLFGVMLYNYASGLMVYMVTSSLFGLVEMHLTRRVLGPPPAVGAAPMPTF
jgi:YidC/Oxa1 family membrane protein insertase